jgi:hypothetical protein
MFKEYYNHRFQKILGVSLCASDGLGDEVVQSKLLEHHLILPLGLVEYYAVAGQHPINSEHNRLLPIEEIFWLGDKLVFMEENQWVGYWGIARHDLAQPNPIVWQGINQETVDWYEEEYKLSQFLMAMWHWMITGEQEMPESE